MLLFKFWYKIRKAGKVLRRLQELEAVWDQDVLPHQDTFFLGKTARGDEVLVNRLTYVLWISYFRFFPETILRFLVPRKIKREMKKKIVRGWSRL